MASALEQMEQHYKNLPRCVFPIFLCSLEESVVPKQASLSMARPQHVVPVPATPCSSVSKMCPQFARAFVQEAASSSYVWDARVWWCAVPRFYLWEPVQSLTRLTSRLAPLWLQACQFLRQKVSGLHAGLPFCVQEDTVWREFALRGNCSWSAPTHTISKIGILMWGVT